MAPKFEFNELALKEINQTYMDEEFAAKDNSSPVVMSTSGLFGNKDKKPINVTSRLGMRQTGRQVNVVMRAHNDD